MTNIAPALALALAGDVVASPAAVTVVDAASVTFVIELHG